MKLIGFELTIKVVEGLLSPKSLNQIEELCARLHAVPTFGRKFSLDQFLQGLFDCLVSFDIDFRLSVHIDFDVGLEKTVVVMLQSLDLLAVS